MKVFSLLKKKSSSPLTVDSTLQERHEYESSDPWYGWEIRQERVLGSPLTPSLRTHNLQSPDNNANINAKQEEEGTTCLRRMHGMKSVSDGHLLGNIEKIRLLGVGSSGKVYLVRSQSTIDRLIPGPYSSEDHVDSGYEAMKIISKATSSPEIMEMEGEVMSALDHPFIVKRLRSFEDEHNRYICMPFVGGGELFHHLHKNGRFPEQVAKFFAAEILTALEYVHSKGICYRDLKPENILLSHTGHIQLIDFGTAQFNNADNKKAIHIAGTVEYLAPEAVKMQKNDFCSDWWALGILIFEMLFGVTPFYSPMNSEMCDLIVKSKLKFPTTPAISPEAKLLLKGLLCKDPSKRLGCSRKTGSTEIKQHPFFTELSSMWENLSLVNPPIVPKLAHSADTSYFENSQTCE
eukprot:TRINITY_DN1604_c0_g1_i1.p1 TRINITY_DN1604_c0_g1~~TRINITY_DN1604_c0_g1_i1.p1  ORF type:complete len:406 (-),score=46.63 TRINITY_DN1604_c0_g1_i1:119-1336(-)